MTKQFDLFTGEMLKEAGIEVVSSHNSEYTEMFHDAAFSILAVKGEITSEDVIGIVGMPLGHPSAVGAAMRAFAVKHELYVSGYRKAKRPSCHAAVIAVWRPRL